MGLGILCALVLAAVGALFLTERYRKEEKERTEREDANAVEYINVFIATLYMVLLSLIVVVMWNNTADVGNDVRAEATGLQALVSTADRMPPTEGSALRTAARDYADSVLATEWPPGADGPTTMPAARILSRARAALAHPVAAGAQVGTIEDQGLAEIDAVSAARDDRLAKSGKGVPVFLLIALGALSLTTIATPLALGLRADPVAFAGLALTTALVCLSYWFVLDLQSPYHGPVHASAQPLRDLLVLLTRQNR